MAVESALLIPVPEAEPVVGRWRTLFDPGALTGIPAHVTLLYPFLPPSQLDEALLQTLDSLLAGFRAFPFSLTEVRRWPEVIYLTPEPVEPFVTLTTTLTQHFPGAVPYGGAFDQVIPHLTIAHTSNPKVVDQIVADVTPHLPIRSAATAVTLMVTDGESWTAHTTFSLGA